jgi:hypothetical protein
MNQKEAERVKQEIFKELLSNLPNCLDDSFSEYIIGSKNIRMSFKIGPVDYGPKLYAEDEENERDWLNEYEVQDIEQEYHEKNKHHITKGVGVILSILRNTLHDFNADIQPHLEYSFEGEIVACFEVEISLHLDDCFFN